MTEPLNVTTERVDDIPLLLAHSDQMGIPGLLDEHFKPHGNWEGMSLGWTTAIWLTHIVSEGDHRMNQMQGWAAQRVQTLSISSSMSGTFAMTAWRWCWMRSRMSRSGSSLRWP
jgi:transposase